MSIVTPDGRYHGDVASLEEAREIQVKAKYIEPRLLSPDEWAKVISSPDRRAEMCGSLGITL